MPATFERYVGHTVDIIYLDRDNQLTQRRISVLAADPDGMTAYCWKRHAPRLFKNENVLAVMPVKRRIG
ncbi:hypothetical protein [Gorillibacterium timonense]|uniref:hypothetical protein n=1 Tax=Gorillibacterium timonense TaxID=1689269 RepID=UPI00071E1740|nr:hypothetical protein [Gorillibacterium timonense]